MQRLALLAAAGVAATALALPALAGAATFKGTVVAKKPARHALVTASSNGVVRTTRVRGSLARFRVGRIVAVRATDLPDGTFAASKIRLVGSSKGARLRGAVVSASAKSLVVSAGMSVLSLSLRSGGAKPALGAGDSVVLGATVLAGSLQTSPKRVHKVGHEGTLELEGIYLATGDDGTIELAVEHRGRVFVHVPSDLVVPDFTAGDEITLLVTVEADGSFTLIRADDEDGGDDGDGGHTGGDRFYVAGVLAELTPGEVGVAIDGNTNRMARCAVPEGFDLSGFEQGQHVYMACSFGGGHRVLVALRKQDGSEHLVAVGWITDITEDSVTVLGDGDPVTCALAGDVDVSEFETGDAVVMGCAKVDGVWTLRALQKRDLPPPPSYVEATGQITELDDLAVTVQGSGDPVTCDVPDGADLSAFSPRRRRAHGLPTSPTTALIAQAPPVGHGDLGRRLSAPPPPPPPPPPNYLEASGPISALGAGSRSRCSPPENPVSCSVPDVANLSAFHVTDYVAMKCVLTSDGPRLEAAPVVLGALGSAVTRLTPCRPPHRTGRPEPSSSGRRGLGSRARARARARPRRS